MNTGIKERHDEAAYAANRAELPPDWSGLLTQAVDDLSRIAQAEIRLLGAHFAASIETAIRDAFAAAVIAAALLCAEACLVVALILLLHHWLQWWLAAGAAGGAMLIAGLTLQLTIRRGAGNPNAR